MEKGGDKLKKISVINPTESYQYNKKRVAAYARVSSNTDEQLQSLVAQTAHYKQYIQSNTDWEFVDVYYDEGISGTSLKNRNGLKRLISDCEKGLVDLIITKSISRFARNTVDCLNLVRRLLVYDVPVIFEKENIRTDEMDSELMLSILAELAEQESRSISENSKWSIRKKFQNGTYIISQPPYGYVNQGGNMVIVPDEAQVVLDIFNWTLQGDSTETIAEKLNARGLQTKRHKDWQASTVRGVIKNEKYIGDVLFQKTYVDDNYHKHINHGDKDSYYMTGHHEAIITREVYQKANQILKQRASEKGNVADKGKYTKRYGFSGRVVCGECGGKFKRRTHTLPNRKYIAWCCMTHINNKEQCAMKYVADEKLKVAFLMMVNKLIFSKDIILKPLYHKLETWTGLEHDIDYQEMKNKLGVIKHKIEDSEQLYQQGYLNQTIYQNMQTKLFEERDHLINQMNQLEQNDVDMMTIQSQLKELITTLNKKEYLTEYDDNLFTSMVDTIKIVSREKVQFILKCGLTLEERVI